MKNTKPMLVLVGEDDEAFYADKFEAVFNEFAPQAEVNLIAGIKHLDLPSDRKAADMITTWVQELSQ